MKNRVYAMLEYYNTIQDIDATLYDEKCIMYMMTDIFGVKMISQMDEFEPSNPRHRLIQGKFEMNEFFLIHNTNTFQFYCDRTFPNSCKQRR